MITVIREIIDTSILTRCTALSGLSQLLVLTDLWWILNTTATLRLLESASETGSFIFLTTCELNFISRFYGISVTEVNRIHFVKAVLHLGHKFTGAMIFVYVIKVNSFGKA